MIYSLTKISNDFNPETENLASILETLKHVEIFYINMYEIGIKIVKIKFFIDFPRLFCCMSENN